MTNTVFPQCFKLNISLIFHQQALVEIFQSKDFDSGKCKPKKDDCLIMTLITAFSHFLQNLFHMLKGKEFLIYSCTLKLNILHNTYPAILAVEGAICKSLMSQSHKTLPSCLLFLLFYILYTLCQRCQQIVRDSSGFLNVLYSNNVEKFYKKK
jgi:hypothetical protein